MWLSTSYQRWDDATFCIYATSSHFDVYTTSMTRHCKDVGFGCRCHIIVVTTSCFDVYTTSITRRCKDSGFGCRRYINVVTMSHLDVYTTSMTRRITDVGIGCRRHINDVTTSGSTSMQRRLPDVVKTSELVVDVISTTWRRRVSTSLQRR